jgi:hypothetical protein
MLELSNQLFKEKDREKLNHDNIIWVSAKSNYYHYLLDIVEKKSQQFESLNHIFSVILRFFEWEDAEEYSFEDKKWLVLETLN